MILFLAESLCPRVFQFLQMKTELLYVCNILVAILKFYEYNAKCIRNIVNRIQSRYIHCKGFSGIIYFFRKKCSRRWQALCNLAKRTDAQHIVQCRNSCFVGIVR